MTELSGYTNELSGYMSYPVVIIKVVSLGCLDWIMNAPGTRLVASPPNCSRTVPSTILKWCPI